MIGAVLYHAADLADEAELIDRLLEAVRPALGGQSFGGFRCIYADSEIQTRWRPLSNRNLEHLKTDLRGRVLSAVHFDVSPQVGLDAATTLELWVNPGWRSGPPSTFPYNVKLIGPSVSADVAGFIDACRATWYAVDSPYGVVYPGTDYGDVHMELTCIPSRMLGEVLTPEAETRLRWLGFWQQYGEEIGHFVRTAYWGNFLGQDLVQRLGGLECIAAAMSAARVEPLENGGVYLQVCENLEMPPPCEAARLQLASFLDPLSIARQHAEFAPRSPWVGANRGSTMPS